MAVTKQRKAEIMSDLLVKFKEAKSIGFSATNTMTVEEFATLRKKLREVNATYTLAKKTIIIKALKEALNIEVNVDQLPGQIGVICSGEDAIAPLSKTNDFMKEANGPKGDLGKITLVLSIIEGEVKDATETKVLAAMPSRETLLGRLVGSMKSPISKLARFFDAASKELEKQGKETIDKLEKGAIAEAPKKEEATKVEAIAETPVEVPVEDVKTEGATTPAQEEVTVEVPIEDTKAEETPKEEKKEEKAE